MSTKQTAKVVSISGGPPPAAPKQSRERLVLLERPVQPGWIVEGTDARGDRAFFTRIEVTGLLPRRFGPFKSRRAALLFLDRVLDQILDGLNEAESQAEELLVPRLYRHSGIAQVVEDGFTSGS